ncbi:hypothetical protein D3C71_2220000 [compost metagenome]
MPFFMISPVCCICFFGCPKGRLYRFFQPLDFQVALGDNAARQYEALLLFAVSNMLAAHSPAFVVP